ncbi:MAG: DUF1295 domain-containing protein [Oscillospiraceae bacterium]|nr:DUF1295 domain-containing protein [Oscillospiraceae bacterium]
MSYLIILCVSLIICAMGFYKYLYFISLGYGFSVAGIGIALLILFRGDLSIAPAICSVLLIVYGIRLGGYLLKREIKSADYNKAMKKEIKDGKGMKFIVKVFMWISCAFLYTLQISPVFFRLKAGKGTDVFSIIGAVVMLLGIIVESVSDHQKSKAKRANPHRFCDSGLFKIVRCPNYFGEILFWTGVFVSGINVYSGIVEWGAAIIGYVCIVYIMFGGARRLEIRQNRNYGSDPEYQNYVKKTPIILPLIPLYSVEKYKFLVG